MRKAWSCCACSRNAASASRSVRGRRYRSGRRDGRPGIDPADELIPVRPAQHYSMGGIRTNYRGESSRMKGLFAAGEAACWDLHGFNRLGGNSVAETVVMGMVVGRKAAERAIRRLGGKRVPTCEVPVIFDGITAPSLIGQVASCASGYSIYRESSFLADQLGALDLLGGRGAGVVVGRGRHQDAAQPRGALGGPGGEIGGNLPRTGCGDHGGQDEKEKCFPHVSSSRRNCRPHGIPAPLPSQHHEKTTRPAGRVVHSMRSRTIAPKV